MSTQPAKVVLVNDTSMISSHFGTQLVGQTFREQFSRVGLQLLGAVGLDISGHERMFERADLLIINGEGSIHHGRNISLLQLAERHRCVLVNCVWQDNPPIPSMFRLKLICARESLSANAIRDNQVSCEVVPDVTFASMLLHAYQKPEPTDDLGITDNVLVEEAGFGTEVETPHHYLNQLCRYRRLCIGRFHAAVAASVLRIPFSTWPSNTHKIEGMLGDMGVPHLHASTQEEAIERCPTSFDHRIADFARDAKARVESMFDDIARIARSPN